MTIKGEILAKKDEKPAYTDPVAWAQHLTFHRVSQVGLERTKRWHGTFPSHDDKWTGADWSNAMQGEAGEAGNVVKKLRRLELNTRGNKDRDRDWDVLIEKLAKECADTLLYLDLLAQYYGIDLAAAVIQKFNQVSEEQGMPERLP